MCIRDSPEGFKDHVDFNTNVEHEYKNKIIDIFITNGFDLVKAPLLEFYQKNSDNVFIIESKKKEPRLYLRDDITPQIIRIASSRFKNKIRPIKLCYYGEVTRKKGSMLRPERQFLQVGSEIIGTDSILADIEIIILAYKSLNDIGIKNITLELTSKIFLAEIFSKIKDLKSLNKLKTFIKQKGPFTLISFISERASRSNDLERIKATVEVDGQNHKLEAVGNGPIAAFIKGMRDEFDLAFRLKDYTEHTRTAGSESEAAAYIELKVPDENGKSVFGVGIDTSITLAPIKAVISAINRIDVS